MTLPLCKEVLDLVGSHPAIDNPSLLYDKYCPVGDNRAKAKAIEALLQAAGHVGKVPMVARLGWQQQLEDSSWVFARFHGVLGARMALNMAVGVQENAGICLDHHLGIPYIPGTALKGLALNAAVEGDSDPDLIREIFGEQHAGKDVVASKGQVSFLSAYPVQGAGLDEDIITCHHTKYYQKGTGPALDNEEPVPVNFVTVRAGAEFRFAVCGRNKRLVEAAKQFLVEAVTDHGVGAKTAAGYGWFHVDVEAEAKREQAEAQAREEAEAQAREEKEKQARLDAMDDPVERLVEEWSEMDNVFAAGKFKELASLGKDEQRAVVRLLQGGWKERWKRWKKTNAKKMQPYVQPALDVAKQWGEELV